MCDYVFSNSRFFQSSGVDGVAGLERHVQRMRHAGTWATGIEVAAAAHLLLRPLHLVTDNVADEGSTLVTEPPEVVAASAWGDPIYLAHFLQWHFEGTVAAPAEAHGGDPASAEASGGEPLPSAVAALSSSTSSSSSSDSDSGDS